MSINKENTTLDSHETSISLKGNTNEIVLLSDLCLDFPKECNISDEWNHLFLYIEWINYFNAKVSLVINGWFESIGDLILINKEFADSHINCQHQFMPPVLRFGHVIDVYSSLECRRNTFDLGNLLLFTGLPSSVQKLSSSSSDYIFKCKKKSSKQHHEQMLQQSDHQNENYFNNSIKAVALSLSLLGPLFNGYFDSIESSAYYRNSADCILHAFIRRYALNDSTLKSNHYHHHHHHHDYDYISQLLIRAHSLIHSEFWLRFLKTYCSEHLFIILLSHNLTCVQFILPKSLISFHKAEYNESLTTEVNNDNLVCQAHNSDLISYGLKLLFTMLHHSSIMYAKFYAPALSHPGLENSMERRHKKLWLFQNCNNQLNCKPVPLSFGHFLNVEKLKQNNKPN
ncbi:uncharacterized protein DC041_0005834 [Schistosoma bovis]|uniref:Uncharacterized protein n=1 Tax=Schistosoma bovis TaxID=6184 RepID=A0A430QG75_SCHBO|nr:uncharacterized protein DC041_0005834 [Schistosoma bovis]